jgi:hypothetical protein
MSKTSPHQIRPNGRYGAMRAAFAEWVLHYDPQPDVARRHLAWFREHGIHPTRWAQRRGAAVSLVDPEHRCPHDGDDRYCPDPTCMARRDSKATA